MKRLSFVCANAVCCLCAVVLPSTIVGSVLDDVSTLDARIDREIDAIADIGQLTAKQRAWRTKWLTGLGGLPTEKTPLNPKEGPVVRCDGFILQNVLFESLPGVYVVGHLCLPDCAAFKPPYPVVLMPLGHSDAGVLAPRYAAHLAMMARAGFAAFSWDPISQGERRQGAKEYDAGFSQCASEHARLGARGWLVGWNFARFRIWDAIRAIDYVETRVDLDCAKLGVCGTSGGGTMSAYLQALDDRIKVSFPNCYVSSFREVFGCRGCHDAEQFYFNQLNDGVNHAAMLAMGFGRVDLAVGSRYADYFPHEGTLATFAVYSNLHARLNRRLPTIAPWHFHCAGPHGLPAPTRAAQTDWMIHCIRGGAVPKAVEAYAGLSTGDHVKSDPANSAPLPYAPNETFMAGGFVRDLPGFRSIYTLIAERAEELRRMRETRSLDRERLREIVRRRAGIRPLAELLRQENPSGDGLQPFDHPKFDWWYLKGPYGCRRENEAAMLSVLGRSVVGRDAERLIVKAAAERAANGGRPTVLKAKGYDCIAAAHAYAAEPQLWASVDFVDPPPSWTEMVTNPNPEMDSFAVGVWGALEDYDWTEL